MLSSLERENGTVLGLPTLLRGGSVSYLGTTYDTRYVIGSGSLGWVSAILDPVLQQPRKVRQPQSKHTSVCCKLTTPLLPFGAQRGRCAHSHRCPLRRLVVVGWIRRRFGWERVRG
jgi:hypothetical protein